MKISFNIPFWYKNQERFENLMITHKVLKNLQNYLILNGLDVEVNVFEFSEDQQYYKDSVYIPLKGDYSKSVKLNKALKILNNRKVDIVSFVDADCFIDLLDYRKVLSFLKEFDETKYYCNNLTKLGSTKYLDCETYGVTPFYTYYNSGIINGLGGIWFCDFSTLYEIGGFDERYTSWGLEDEDIGKRLTLKGLQFSQLPFKVYHLPHPVESSKQNQDERSIQEDIFKRDNTIIRPSLLNNYQC